MRLTIHSMNGSSVPRHCAVMEAGLPSNECPSSEWNFIQTWALLRHSLPNHIRNESLIFDLVATNPSAIYLTGKTSTRQYISEGIVTQTNYEPGTSQVSTTQQVVIADALSAVSSIWNIITSYGKTEVYHGASFNDYQKTVHAIANDYYQPYSSVFCQRDTIQGPNDERVVAFPIAPAVDYGINSSLLSNINASVSGFPAVEVPSVRRAQLLELPGLESENRVKWVQLPESPLTGVSVGLIILLPQNPLISPKQTGRDIVVCNIGAGWGASLINMTSTRGTNGATSSVVKFFYSNCLNSNFSEDKSPLSRFDIFTDDPLEFALPEFPSIPIEIDVEWAEYLNPYVPSANTTVIDFLLKYLASNGSKSASPEVATRDIISGLMTNGLARSAFTSELQGNIKLTKDNMTVQMPTGSSYVIKKERAPDGSSWLTGKSDIFTVNPEESKDWVKLRVDSTIQGYAYNIEGPAPKIAIAFLLTYCCLALAHCFYSGISGTFSLQTFPREVLTTLTGFVS